MSQLLLLSYLLFLQRMFVSSSIAPMVEHVFQTLLVYLPVNVYLNITENIVNRVSPLINLFTRFLLLYNWDNRRYWQLCICINIFIYVYINTDILKLLSNFTYCRSFSEYACTSSPCLNGGTCNELGNGQYNCRCEPSYFGDYCESLQCEFVILFIMLYLIISDNTFTVVLWNHFNIQNIGVPTVKLSNICYSRDLSHSELVRLFNLEIFIVFCGRII